MPSTASDQSMQRVAREAMRRVIEALPGIAAQYEHSNVDIYPALLREMPGPSPEAVSNAGLIHARHMAFRFAGQTQGLACSRIALGNRMAGKDSDAPWQDTARREAEENRSDAIYFPTDIGAFGEGVSEAIYAVEAMNPTTASELDAIGELQVATNLTSDKWRGTFGRPAQSVYSELQSDLRQAWSSVLDETLLDDVNSETFYVQFRRSIPSLRFDKTWSTLELVIENVISWGLHGVALTEQGLSQRHSNSFDSLGL